MLLSEKNIVRASSSTFSCKLASTSASSAGAGGASGSIFDTGVVPAASGLQVVGRFAMEAAARTPFALPAGMGPAQVLQTVFHHYAAFGRTHADTPQTMGDTAGVATIDNSGFAKMCKECPGLFSRRLTPADLDIIFSRMTVRRGER